MPRLKKIKSHLTLCLQMSSAGTLCKQLGPRTGLTISGSKLLNILWDFRKEFFNKVDFEKKYQSFEIVVCCSYSRLCSQMKCSGVCTMGSLKVCQNRTEHIFIAKTPIPVVEFKLFIECVCQLLLPAY